MHPINSEFFGQTGILCLFSYGGNLLSGWIEKQIGLNRYIVTDGVVTTTCSIAKTTSDATTLPSGTCTFVLSAPNSLNLPDKFISSLDSRRCGTTDGLGYAWNINPPETEIARVINNNLYYDLEQGALQAAPVSDEIFGASFTVTATSKIRVRLLMTKSEDYGDANFTLALHPDDNTSPDFGTTLASQTFYDTVISGSVQSVLLEFTNASTVILTPGRYWVAFSDNYSEDPLTSSGAAWFWEENLVDVTVKNEYNFYSDPATVSTNIDNTNGFQMCIEAISD